MPRKPHVFVAVYTGNSISEARIIEASADPDIVAYVVDRLLNRTNSEVPANPIVDAKRAGRRRALKIIKGGLDG